MLGPRENRKSKLMYVNHVALWSAQVKRLRNSIRYCLLWYPPILHWTNPGPSIELLNFLSFNKFPGLSDCFHRRQSQRIQEIRAGARQSSGRRQVKTFRLHLCSLGLLLDQSNLAVSLSVYTRYPSLSIRPIKNTRSTYLISISRPILWLPV